MGLTASRESAFARTKARAASAARPDPPLARKAPRNPAAPTIAAPITGPKAQASDQLARKTPMARLTVWGLDRSKHRLTSATDWEKAAAPIAIGNAAMTMRAKKFVVNPSRP